MKNTEVMENKAVETTEVVAKEVKAPAKKSVEPKQEVKVEETKVEVAKNETKKNTFISIEEVTKMYGEAGIKCTNPTAKGNYRIMGSKSSLNIKPKKGYYIYTSNTDFDLIQAAELKADDLVVEKGTNSQDKNRPNTVICQTVETLKQLFRVYATNPDNVVAEPTK